MRRPRKSINQINVVPYIDVMLVLLVIFMITAPLITPGEITLPSVGSVLTTPVTPIQIQIRRDGSLWLKDGNASPVRLDRDELITRIQARQRQTRELPVVISADKDVRFRLGPIQLELEVAATNTGGGEAGIKFWVVTIGGKAETSKARTHTIHLELHPLAADGTDLVVGARANEEPG